MVPADVVRRAADYLDRHGVERPLVDAESLLSGVLGLDRTALYGRSEELSSAEARQFGRALCRRCAGTPLQHITGTQGFRRLVLDVRPGVFVPRPETESVVQVGLDLIRGQTAPVVVDLGTGSGAIALAIADEHPGARVVAVDLAPEAVALARANAERLELDIEVRHGDLFGALPNELRSSVDLIVTNPPYLEPEAFPGLSADVRADPRESLLGGVSVHRRVLSGVKEWLVPGGWFVGEIGDEQGAEVSALARSAGLIDITVHPDLNGRDRVVSARTP